MKNEKGGVKKYKTYKRHKDARSTYNAQTQKSENCTPKLEKD